MVEVPEYIRSLIPYVPGKPIEETQREFKLKKVVKLASNENPLGTSLKVIQAIRTHLRDLHRYPDASGFNLKQALNKHWGLQEGQKNSVILGNGSNELIDLLIRTFCRVGDAIVTSRAAFIAYKLCAQIHGAKTLEVPIDQDLVFDPEHWVSLVTKEERVRVVFIANPNNPTGSYLPSFALKNLIHKIASIRGGSVVIVLDLAYWEYMRDLDAVNPLDWLKDYPNLVLLRTFSKAYGLAGLRVGCGIGSPELIANLEKVRQPFNMNSLALAAAEAAVQDFNFIKRSQKENARGISFWEENLKVLEVPFWKSQGNFILLNAQEGFGLSGQNLFDACLRKGLIFRPVTNYGLPGALRVTVGTRLDNGFALKILKEIRGTKKSWRT